MVADQGALRLHVYLTSTGHIFTAHIKVKVTDREEAKHYAHRNDAQPAFLPSRAP
jgi:hypothetical protein